MWRTSRNLCATFIIVSGSEIFALQLHKHLFYAEEELETTVNA